jgi:hypothetical protein
LHEVVIFNSGNDDALPPERLTISTTGTLIAFDATAGYAAQRATPDALHFTADPGTIDPLRPGQRRVIGWIRLERDTEVAVDVVTHSNSP